MIWIMYHIFLYKPVVIYFRLFYCNIILLCIYNVIICTFINYHTLYTKPFYFNIFQLAYVFMIFYEYYFFLENIVSDK